jgi:ABC-type multidrug transport system ATPase subunit
MNIVLENIEKTFSKKKIFQGVKANYISGNRYGIAGNNGSGKSTLLKIIAGFTTPSSGNISYKIAETSIPVDSIFEHISYAAPYIDLPQDLTLSELLDFHFSMKKRGVHATNTELNTHFQLPLNSTINTFSSGMIQRVKLALAFFTHSEILILDEPTETLDENGFILYKKLLETYTQNRITIIASNKDRDFIDCQSILTVTDYQ